MSRLLVFVLAQLALVLIPAGLLEGPVGDQQDSWGWSTVIVSDTGTGIRQLRMETSMLPLGGVKIFFRLIGETFSWERSNIRQLDVLLSLAMTQCAVPPPT